MLAAQSKERVTKIRKPFFLIATALIGLALFHSPLHAKPVCKAESFPRLPDVAIKSVTQEAQPVTHCKVFGVIGPEIHFELLLPEQWNGKFVMGGGGGFVGAVVNTSLMYGSLQAGYATVGTDTGHQGHPLDASWAHNNLERLVNFGHQAVHRTAVTAKALTKAYYQNDIARSYFTGCSRGGATLPRGFRRHCRRCSGFQLNPRPCSACIADKSGYVSGPQQSIGSSGWPQRAGID